METGAGTDSPLEVEKASKARRKIEVDAVFDIETEDWVTFVACGVLDKDGGYADRLWPDEEEIALAILHIEGDVWAHSGGSLDFKWLLEWATKFDMTATVSASGSNIVSMTVWDPDNRGVRTRFFDSWALTKISLAELTAGLGVRKQELGFPCHCGQATPSHPKGCGGYCAISRKMSPADLRRLREYLRDDCYSLMEALTELNRWAETVDVDLGATVGGSAWRNAQRVLGLPNAALSKADHEFARAGYYGGRVQLFRPLSASGFETDVNSMYPSRLATCPLPCGDFERVFGGDARKRYTKGAAGIYRAEVTVPEMHIPPLPYRLKDRIAYPYGTFTGTWTLPELEYAESLGVAVLPLEAMTWAASSVIFTEWVDHVFALRSQAPCHDPEGNCPNRGRACKDHSKKSPFGVFMKFYLNSLTGKLGSRMEQDRFDVNPEKIAECKGRGDCAEECTGKCGCHRPIPNNPYVHVRTIFRLDACAHVEWAAYLTSEARVEWHRQAVSVADGFDLTYGDTDSIFSERKRTRNVGSALGQWEDTGPYTEFRGVAPKVYTFRRADKRKVKAKGIALPKDPEQAAKLLEFGGTATRRGALGFRAAIRKGGFFLRDDLKRKVGQGFGDRILTEHGYTRAPSIEEVRHLE